MTIDWRILLALALIVTLAFGWLLLSRAELKAELAQAQAGATVLAAANDAFRDSAQKQMAAALALKNETALRAAKQAAAERQANAVAARYTQAAATIARQQARGNDCAAASRLIDRYRQARP